MKTLTSIVVVVAALAVMVQSRVAQSPVAELLPRKMHDLPAVVLKVVDRDGLVSGVIQSLWRAVLSESARLLGPTAIPQ